MLEATGNVTYVGVADWWVRHVWVECDGTRSALHACGDDLIAGFAWGTRGSAARELARAILADATGNEAIAERYCRELTHAVVAGLPRTGFELDRADVLAWLDAVAAPLPAAAACPFTRARHLARGGPLPAHTRLRLESRHGRGSAAREGRAARACGS